MGSSSANTRTGLHHGFLRRLKFPRPLEQRRPTTNPRWKTRDFICSTTTCQLTLNTHIYMMSTYRKTQPTNRHVERERGVTCAFDRLLATVAIRKYKRDWLQRTKVTKVPQRNRPTPHRRPSIIGRRIASRAASSERRSSASDLSTWPLGWTTPVETNITATRLIQ